MFQQEVLQGPPSQWTLFLYETPEAVGGLQRASIESSKWMNKDFVVFFGLKQVVLQHHVSLQLFSSVKLVLLSRFQKVVTLKKFQIYCKGENSSGFLGGYPPLGLDFLLIAMVI